MTEALDGEVIAPPLTKLGPATLLHLCEQNPDFMLRISMAELATLLRGSMSAGYIRERCHGGGELYRAQG